MVATTPGRKAAVQILEILEMVEMFQILEILVLHPPPTRPPDPVAGRT